VSYLYLLSFKLIAEWETIVDFNAASVMAREKLGVGLLMVTI